MSMASFGLILDLQFLLQFTIFLPNSQFFKQLLDLWLL
jgi:hypothetical protein